MPELRTWSPAVPTSAPRENMAACFDACTESMYDICGRSLGAMAPICDEYRYTRTAIGCGSGAPDVDPKGVRR